MKSEEFVIFRNLINYPLLRDMALLSEVAPEIEHADRAFIQGICASVHDLLEFAAAHGFSGNVWKLYLTERIVNDENAFSLSCERRQMPDNSLYEAALSDISILKEIADCDFKALAERTGIKQIACLSFFRTDPSRSVYYSHTIRDAIASLSDTMFGGAAAEEMLLSLARFYGEYGVGAPGLHKAFRVEKDASGVSIVPIRNIRHVRLSDLVGYEEAKRTLTENTEAFLAGRPANNCLLYGDAGTGTSTSIMAIANAYFPRGLRVIELYKHQSKLLHEVVNQIKNRNYRFIIYMDDLSFEEFETEYKYLKAVIEGGLEKKPENLLIYATSNRRHLIRETFKDKPALLDDDVHRGETVQEKLSLFHRFGVTIYYGAPSRADYLEIVRTLADRAGLDGMDEETLAKEAERFAMQHGNRSGRTATQLIDELLGKRP